MIEAALQYPNEIREGKFVLPDKPGIGHPLKLSELEKIIWVFKSHLHIFDLAKSTKEVAFLSSVKGDYSYRDLDRFTGYFQEILKEHSDSLKWPVAFLSESSDELVLAIAAGWKL